MSQGEIIRYRCPNIACPTRRGQASSWWEIINETELRCPFCRAIYTRARLQRETQNHINSIRGRQPGQWPQETRRSYCSRCNRQTMTLYGQNSSGQTTATCTECNPPSPPRPVTVGSLSNMSQDQSPSSPVLFGNYSPPSSPLRASQSPDRANELTQPVDDDSLSSPPSSPEGLSSGERAIRRGPRGVAESRLALRRNAPPAARTLSSRLSLVDSSLQPPQQGVRATPLERRRAAIQDINRAVGYRVPARRAQTPLTFNSPPRAAQSDLAGLWSNARSLSVGVVGHQREQQFLALQPSDVSWLVSSGVTPGRFLSIGQGPYWDSVLRLRRENREGKTETEAREEKVDENPEINKLKKKINNAKKKSTSQPAVRHLLFEDSKHSKPKKPKEAYDVYVGNAPITELLKDKDEDGDPQNNIILQRDTKPFNAVALPKDYLKNILTTNSYFNQTKYQCKNNITDSLDVTEDNIVFDKANRETYQFINGKALNIHDGIFLRTQLLSMLNSQKKHFLYHVHKNINITPIASADKVRWFSPPKKIKGWTDNIPDWNSYEQGTALNEAHMEVGDMVSADHCQKGFSNFLITIAPLKKRRTAQFYSKRTKTKKSGGRRKGGKRKTKKKKKKRKRKKKKKTRKKN